MSGRDHCRRGRGEDLQEGMQLRLKALVGVVEGGELCADMQHFLEGVGGVLADYVCPAHLTGVAAGFLCRWFLGDWNWGLPESGPGVGSGHRLGTVGGLFQEMATVSGCFRCSTYIVQRSSRCAWAPSLVRKG